MNRFQTIVAIALSLISFPGFAQNKKGLGGNNLTVATTMRQAESPYESPRKDCYAVAISATGPFNDNSLNALAFPDNDCREFYTAVNRQFRYKYNIRQFDLLDLENSRRGYQQALDLLHRVRGEQIKKGDLVLLYFSGHGLTIDGQYHFPFSDSDVAGKERMLTGAEIAMTAEYLANRGANVLIFLDTCEAGSIQNEKINLTGTGGVAFFPASSETTSTQENLSIGSSPFGDRLKSVLSGEWMGDRADTLTVAALGRELTPTVVGDITPQYCDSGETDIRNLVLADNTRRIKQYNRTLDKYKEYIGKGQEAVSQRRFNEALAIYESAENLAKNELYQDDVVNLQPDIEELNRQISIAIQKPANNADWKYLSSMNEKNSLLSLSPGEMVMLYLGCGSYYKAGNDLNSAYYFFRKAYDKGDRTNAPYEIYQVAKGGNVPSNKPLTEDEWMKMLMIASKNGNRSAKKKLDQDGVLKDVVKRVKYAFAGEDMLFGFAVSTDGKETMFPFGIQLDSYWGPLHLGVDVGMGAFQYFEKGYGSRSIPSTQTVEGIAVPEPGLLTSSIGEPFGSLSFTITPGFFYKFVSLDCGLGRMWTKTVTTDIFLDSVSNPLNDPELADKNYSILNLRFEERTSKDGYFVIKPGMSFVLPIDWIEEMDLYLGGRYRICPKEKALNGFECFLGAVFSMGI